MLTLTIYRLLRVMVGIRARSRGAARGWAAKRRGTRGGGDGRRGAGSGTRRAAGRPSDHGWRSRGVEGLPQSEFEARERRLHASPWRLPASAPAPCCVTAVVFLRHPACPPSRTAGSRAMGTASLSADARAGRSGSCEAAPSPCMASSLRAVMASKEPGRRSAPMVDP